MAFSRRLFPAAVLAASLFATPFEVALAQGGPTVGTPGGASQTAPSNSEGFRAGGTGVVGTTQVAPAPATGAVRATPQRQRRRQHARRAQQRPRARAAAPAAAVPGDAAPATPTPGTVPLPR